MNVNEDHEGTASHLPVLKWAQAEVQEHGWGGSVLEYGGGMFSTEFLHELDRLGFPTLTIEADPEWTEWLEKAYPGHRIVAKPPDDWWDVVLIDHGKDGTWIDERAFALRAVRNRCGIALVHDWHIGRGHRERDVRAWRYHGWYAPDAGTMHTAIVSDHVDVGKAVIPGGYIYTDWDDAPGAWDAEGVWPN